MNVTEEGTPVEQPNGYGAAWPTTLCEEFVTGIHAAADRVTARHLEILERSEGITPTCRQGCCHCCRYHILTNIAEVHALAQYVKRNFSATQIDALRLRTRQWHDWDNSRPGRAATSLTAEPAGLADYEHNCPLLLDGVCLAYPARPLVCRTHFVRSPAALCAAATDSEAAEDAPIALTSVVAATSSFVDAIGTYVENTGEDVSRSMVLLPHGLAREMAWDFALAP